MRRMPPAVIQTTPAAAAHKPDRRTDRPREYRPGQPCRYGLMSRVKPGTQTRVDTNNKNIGPITRTSFTVTTPSTSPDDDTIESITGGSRMRRKALRTCKYSEAYRRTGLRAAAGRARDPGLRSTRDPRRLRVYSRRPRATAMRLS